MKNTLEYVWDWYLAEHASDRSEKEMELSRSVNGAADDLRELLGEEQENALQTYEDLQNQLAALLEAEAFVKGIRFATSYMMDALSKK